MVRKRTAAELDLHDDAAPAAAYGAHQRLQPRRAPPPGASAITGSTNPAAPSFIGDLGGTPSLLLPTLNIESNAGGGPALLLPPPGGLQQRLLPPAAPPPTAPAVCGFSGMPLFQSEADRGAGGGLPVASSCAAAPLSGADDAAPSATAWVDGIIRDLISSSTAEVSIPQLIQNVREVIHPCNPNLAAVLEYRLRSLTSAIPSPSDHHHHPHLPAAPTLLSLPAAATEPSEKRREMRPQHQQAAAAPAMHTTTRRTDQQFPTSMTPPASQFLNWENNPTQIHTRLPITAGAVPPNLSITHPGTQQLQQQPPPAPQQQQQNQQYRSQQQQHRQQSQQQQQQQQQEQQQNSGASGWGKPTWSVRSRRATAVWPSSSIGSVEQQTDGGRPRWHLATPAAADGVPIRQPPLREDSRRRRRDLLCHEPDGDQPLHEPVVGAELEGVQGKQQPVLR